MDYKKLYYSIIDNAKNRELYGEQGYEMHHIIPKSLGGTNKKENLVKLTYKEHYICHLLLVKMCENTNQLIKMTTALMWLTKSNHGKRLTNSRMFEVARKQRSKAQRKWKNEIIDETGLTRAQFESRLGIAKRQNSEIFHFWHEQYGEFKGTSYELSLHRNELNGYSTNLYKVATEKRFHCLNWMLFENRYIGIDGFNIQKKTRMSISAKNRQSRLGMKHHYDNIGKYKLAIIGSELSNKLLAEGYYLK